MGNVFNKEGEEIVISISYHPGEFLQEEVEERQLVKSEFAKKIDMTPSHLSDLFKGKRHIGARLALKLEKELGISAEFWLNMQTKFDLAEARKLEVA
jgi:HTH-type transcriptional regulator/antitoxin HigA